jgi:hypothetical protein
LNACLFLGLKEVVLAAGSFTLAWTHPVQPARWEEDWNVGLAGFQLVEVRLENPGAGRVPPEGSVFDGKAWRYHPPLAFVEDRLQIDRRHGGGSWQICTKAGCAPLPEDTAQPGAMATLKPCP